MCSSPVLAYANYTLPFEVEIDASLNGLGAVLSQYQDGRRRVISYASRTLRGAEKNMQRYSSFKLELLGLKWAVTEKFREYLLGSKFTVYTDNNPLAHLTSAKLDAVGQRWAGALASFDFDVKYKPGKSNKAADALSLKSHTKAGKDVLFTSEIYVQAAGLTTIPDDLRLALTMCSVDAVNCEPSQPPEQTPAATSSLIFPTYTTAQLQEFQVKDGAIGKIWHYRNLNRRPS